jgi:DNA-binding Lrp family transcriptional regulator
MIKLDLKDRKILYELDANSRQSFAKIGKKMGVSKNIVQYRVSKLIEKEIILGFYTNIDSFKLGYFAVRFYLIFQNTTPEILEEIIEFYAKKNKYLFHCSKIEGRYDLVVNMWVKNLNEFYDFWEKGLSKYRKYIQKDVFTIFIQSMRFRYSFLLPDSYTRSDREKIEITGAGETTVEIDDLDWEILKLLAYNARMPIKEIAKKLKTTITVVNYRIKKLQKQGVIQGFNLSLNEKKLGYVIYKVDIFLDDYSKKHQIFNYLKYNPHLMWASKSMGVSDLEVEFVVENLEQLDQILQDIVTRFPNIIRNYQYFSSKKDYGTVFLPEK